MENGNDFGSIQTPAWSSNTPWNDEFFGKYGKHIKIALSVIIAVAILIIVAIVIIVPVVEYVSRPTYLEIAVAPAGAKVEVNGKSYTNGVYDSFAAGSYEAVISSIGFETKTVSFTVAEHETSYLYAYLLNDAEGLEYFLKSAEDLAVLGKIDDAEVVEFMDEYNRQIALKDELPLEVTISYTSEFTWYDTDGSANTGNRPMAGTVTLRDGSSLADCDMAFCLWVDLDYFAEADVVVPVAEALAERGFDLDDYRVIYL